MFLNYCINTWSIYHNQACTKQVIIYINFYMINFANFFKF